MTRIDPKETKTQEEPVLIIDDDQEIRGILQERLLIEGLGSAPASSGEEGLSLYFARLAEGKPFQTIILDIRMKGISGIELLKLIRLIDQGSTILMISGLGDLSKAVLCLRHGADDYLSKPIKIWDLKARLSTAQGRRRALNLRQGGETNKGLQWGTAFIPQIPQEISSVLDTATSIPGESKPDDAKSPHFGEGRGGSSSRDQNSNAQEEMMKSPGPPKDPEVPSTGKEEKGQKGRKGGSFQDTPRHGKGESRANAARESGFLPPGPGKKAPRSPADSALRPGEEADLRAASPLDVFFFMIQQLEKQELGWLDHSKKLSLYLSKAAALLIGELELTTTDLDALRLAGLVHNLGLIRAHGTLGQGFSSPPQATSPLREIDSALIEDLTLPARVLEGLLPFLGPGERPSAEAAQSILASAGRFRRQIQEYGCVLEKKTRKQAPGEEPSGKKAAEDRESRYETLGLLFELADLCFHAQGQPKDARSAPYLPSLKTYADSTGFPFETVWDTLTRLIRNS